MKKTVRKIREMSFFRMQKAERREMGRKVIFACLGIFLIGIGVSWNAAAGLGNDPVGIFYDGIRAALNLEPEQLGAASNIVNLALAVLLLLVGRRYLSIGTLIYILPYGVCVSLGSWIYAQLFAGDGLVGQIAASVAGCTLLYIGVAIFVTVDIGLDPMTGVAMVIRDRLHWDFKRAKWLFDGTLTLVGFLLGGTLGVVTLLTALLAGPSIQFISGKLTGIRNRFSDGK